MLRAEKQCMPDELTSCQRKNQGRHYKDNVFTKLLAVGLLLELSGSYSNHTHCRLLWGLVPKSLSYPFYKTPLPVPRIWVGTSIT